MKKLLASVMRFADDLLFPREVVCLCCDRALGEDAEGGVCPACAEALEELNVRQAAWDAAHSREDLPEGIAFVCAAYPYEGPVRRLVHRLKYESVREAAEILARPMAYLHAEEEEILVPVPTDRTRRRVRGFNQATLLAGHLSDTLGMEMCEALRRVEGRAPQTGLSLEQRRKNLVGCMKADSVVRGRRVLLIDDVYTTGSTVAEAARALYAAGAASVGVFAAARSSGAQADKDVPFLLRIRRK